MKKIFKYFGLFLTVVLMGAFTACIQEEEIETADLGLNIKVFSPTKVITGQPVTINGSGFADVTEVVFPGEIVVTSFERVGKSMIRVVTPAGIPAEGGKLKVRTEKEEAESSATMTLGKVVISGFSKQPGESLTGGEQLTVYGSDLEFINAVELLDPDGNPYILQDKDFYRKSTNNVIITIPKRNIFTGTFAGKLFAVDGKEYMLPELKYEPSTEGGHWATVKKTIWKNDDPEGHGPVSWNGTYRFAGEGFETGEEIAIIPTDTWAKLKSETFYALIQATDPQVRVTTGWWSVTLTPDDIQPGNELLTDNGDGTFSVEVNLSGNADLLALLDEQHLLFTGDRYTLLELYVNEQEWVEGEEEGHWETVKTPVWTNDDPDGHGAVAWNGTYRFAGEGFETGEEIAIIPADTWAKLKSETFYVLLKGEDPQVRVTTGWWSVTWTGNDIQPGNELLTDNGDGTWTLEVNLSDDADLLALLDEQHLLLTGDRYTPLEIYFATQEWVGGGGHMELVKTPFWTNDDPDGHGAVAWNGTYRFAGEGFETGEEIAIIPADVWEKIKTETFYLTLKGEDPQVRVTTGWWSVTWTGNDIQPGNELLTDNGDGTWTLEVNLSGDADLLALLDEQHLLFTGDRYTPLELYFAKEEWVGGGGGGSKPQEEIVWEGDGSAGAVAWNGTYRFAGEGFETGEEIAIIPADTWARIKSETFYLLLEAEDPQIRVTTGWWSVTWTGNDIQPGNELLTDNGDGTWTLEVNLSSDADLLALLDEQHLLFTGDRYTPKKIYFLK